MRWLFTAGVLLFCTACQPKTSSTPDYPVTVFPTSTKQPVTPAVQSTPAVVESPTINWDSVTLLPFGTKEGDEAESAGATTEQTEETVGIPDPLTESDLNLLIAADPPFELSDAEVTLGRLALPVDLFSIQGGFGIESIEVNNMPGWRFLAFDLPLPQEGELGPVIRAPISGEVMAGAMEMINNQTAQTISVDHQLGDDQLVRMTYVYSGEIEVLFVLGQTVQAGDVLFRLTRDTGSVEYLGSTPVLPPEGAVLTLHASIDSVTPQESGAESLKFVRYISLTPSGFLKDRDGWIISPSIQ